MNWKLGFFLFLCLTAFSNFGFATDLPRCARVLRFISNAEVIEKINGRVSGSARYEVASPPQSIYERKHYTSEKWRELYYSVRSFLVDSKINKLDSYDEEIDIQELYQKVIEKSEADLLAVLAGYLKSVGYRVLHINKVTYYTTGHGEQVLSSVKRPGIIVVPQSTEDLDSYLSSNLIIIHIATFDPNENTFNKTLNISFLGAAKLMKLGRNF